MKNLHSLLVLAGLSAGLSLQAAQPSINPPGVGAAAVRIQPAAALGGAEPAVPAAAPEAAPASIAELPNNAPPPVASATGTNALRLNFRGAPLNLVLDYLSDAAGFIINKESDVHGTVDVWSKECVSKDEAVDLLSSVLRKNGYVVTRNGRILNIMSLDNFKYADLPVSVGEKPDDMDGSDTIETRIIPVKYASAEQLKANLDALLPPSSTSLTVNESANSLILVASRRDIRRMLRIVAALDTAMSGTSTVRVFQLRYADAKALATEIQALFAQPSQTGNTGRGGFFGFMRGFGGRGGGGGNNSAPSNPATGSKVTATSDDYANCLIVSASEENMATIEDMVKRVDVAMTDVTELRVFHLVHADPSEIADQLNSLFPDSSRSESGPAFGFRFGPFGGRGNSQATSNDRTKKMSTVIAVADPRTCSVLVSAASQLMPHIERMISDLDSSSARHEVVQVYDLKNADPMDVQTALQTLFQRSGSIRTQNNQNQNPLLSQNNPLMTRIQQSANQSSTSSSFGSTGGRGGASGGMGF